MKIAKIYSHRNGRDILESPKFNLAFREFQAVIGIEPQDWDARTYPASSSAPKATASIINKARKLRGQTPVLPGSREDEVMSLDRLRQLATRVA